MGCGRGPLPWAPPDRHRGGAADPAAPRGPIWYLVKMSRTWPRMVLASTSLSCAPSGSGSAARPAAELRTTWRPRCISAGRGEPNICVATGPPSRSPVPAFLIGRKGRPRGRQDFAPDSDGGGLLRAGPRPPWSWPSADGDGAADRDDTKPVLTAGHAHGGLSYPHHGQWGATAALALCGAIVRTQKPASGKARIAKPVGRRRRHKKAASPVRASGRKVGW